STRDWSADVCSSDLANVALDVAGIAAAARVVRHGPVDIVANVKIGEAVAVEVGPGGRGAPGRIVQARLRGHIDKTPALRRVVRRSEERPVGEGCTSE